MLERVVTGRIFLATAVTVFLVLAGVWSLANTSLLQHVAQNWNLADHPHDKRAYVTQVMAGSPKVAGDENGLFLMAGASLTLRSLGQSTAILDRMQGLGWQAYDVTTSGQTVFAVQDIIAHTPQDQPLFVLLGYSELRLFGAPEVRNFGELGLAPHEGDNLDRNQLAFVLSRLDNAVLNAVFGQNAEVSNVPTHHQIVSETVQPGPYASRLAAARTDHQAQALDHLDGIHEAVKARSDATLVLYLEPLNPALYENPQAARLLNAARDVILDWAQQNAVPVIAARKLTELEPQMFYDFGHLGDRDVGITLSSHVADALGSLAQRDSQ